ncbi:hypothetical protein HAX54_029034, partial [Datura stramonium]|nr:hypothetical protein [Datura stramonium]
SLEFDFPYFFRPGEEKKEILDFVASTHRELHYWRSFNKIRKFSVVFVQNIPTRDLLKMSIYG